MPVVDDDDDDDDVAASAAAATVAAAAAVFAFLISNFWVLLGQPKRRSCLFIKYAVLCLVSLPCSCI